MTQFVAKLVKSFGSLGHAAESLDDFRYLNKPLNRRIRLDTLPGPKVPTLPEGEWLLNPGKTNRG